MKHRSREWKKWYEQRLRKLDWKYRYSTESSLHYRPSLREVGNILWYHVSTLVAISIFGSIVLLGAAFIFVFLNLLFDYFATAGWISPQNRAEVLVFLLQLIWAIIVVFIVREKQDRKQYRTITERGV